MESALPDRPMDPEDLTETDRAILNELRKGRDSDQQPWGIATKGRLIDETGFSRNTVYNRLEVLEAAGHVELIHDGTREWQFVSDPREGGDGG